MTTTRGVFTDKFPFACALTLRLLRRRVHLSRELADDVVRARGYVEDRKMDDDVTELNFFDEKLHGLQREWYANGALFWESTYIEDRRHGLLREWFDNGVLRLQNEYVHGMQHGLSRGWYATGILRWHYEYVAGKLCGPALYWNEAGTVSLAVEHL